MKPIALNQATMFVSFNSPFSISSFSINYFGNDTTAASVDMTSVIVSNNLIPSDNSVCATCSTLPLSSQFSLNF